MEATASSKRIKASVLPDEILEEILARLPAKPLRRFQCVSRSWRQLITSPSFRDLHSSRSAAGSAAGDHRQIFIRPAGYCESFYACRRQQSPAGTTSPMTAVEEILSFSHFPQGNVFPIGKSCHGLILLRCVEYSAHYVWNPSTGEILALPDRTPFKMAASGCSPRSMFVSYGMGHCSMTNEHKVVRMYSLGDDELPHSTATTICEVFTLDKSTHWRPAATEPPACRLRVRGSQGAVLCNGNLHFVGQDGAITTFNVTDETFGTLMPPSDLRYSSFDLTEIDGCLCVYFSSHLNPTPGHPYRIWLLRDYAAAGGGRWEELRCIDWGAMADAERAALKSYWIAPIAMMMCPDGSSSTRTTKKKMMFGTGSCKVFVVDPAGDGVPEIIFSLDGARDGQFPTVGLFEESLTTVGRTSDEIIFSSPSAEAWCDVLARLPARAVGRLNQVCRDWRAMIKNEFFVDLHLYQANLGRSPQVMFTDGKPNSFKSLENLSIVGAFDAMPPPLVDDSSRMVCSKPCHGLNAGSFMCYDFVCNPITGYYKALPLGDDRELRGSSSVFSDITRRSLGPNGADDSMMFTGRFGLGYDMEMGTHVLVRITYEERNLTTREYRLECEIRYIEDILWEELDPPQRPIADTPPAYINGKIYWMADRNLGHYRCSPRHEIIALDVSARKFELLEGPLLIHEDGDERVSIVELQGQLCMVCSHPRKGTLEIWTMKDDKGWWAMEYYIELGRFSPEYSSELVTPIAIDPKDGRILLTTGKALGYYDPKTAKMQTIYSLGKHIKNKKFVPILVQESLINPCDRVV